MKVFISWSGERSRRVAELLDVWVQSVIQAVDPWVSSQDIDRGALWFSEITNQLSNTTNGIICITRDNKEKPWILFEAGALAKGLSSTRVFTFLIDLDPQDIKDPLAQFNHTLPTRVSMYKLISTINNSLVDNKLKDPILNNAFDTYWPQFEERFALIISETESNSPDEPRPAEDILIEVLDGIRHIDKRLRTVEQDLSNPKKPASTNSKVDMQKVVRILADSQVIREIRKLLNDGAPDEEVFASFPNKDETWIKQVISQYRKAE